MRIILLSLMLVSINSHAFSIYENCNQLDDRITNCWVEQEDDQGNQSSGWDVQVNNNLRHTDNDDNRMQEEN